MAGFHHAHSCPHPGCDALLYRVILPVARDHLAVDAHAGHDMAVLPVPVRRLVFIHEIHVDGIVGNLLVVLCVQVKQRLSQFLQTEDPRFRRGEGVHPGDHTRAVLVGVCLIHSLTDQGIRDQYGPPHDLVRQDPRGIQRLDHLLGMCSHMGEHLISVQVL